MPASSQASPSLLQNAQTNRPCLQQGLKIKSESSGTIASKSNINPAQPEVSAVWAQCALMRRPGSFSTTPCTLNQSRQTAKARDDLKTKHVPNNRLELRFPRREGISKPIVEYLKGRR